MKKIKTLLLGLASLLIISCGCPNLINDYNSNYESSIEKEDYKKITETEETDVEEETEVEEVDEKPLEETDVEDTISENEKYEIKGFELLYVIKDCDINVKQVKYDVTHNNQTCNIKKYNHDCTIESIRLYFNYHETNGYTENNIYIYHIDNDVAIYKMKTKYSFNPYVNSASFENNTIFINVDIISSL